MSEPLRFTPELDFANKLERQVQDALKAVGLGDERVFAFAEKGKSIVLENTPRALLRDAYAHAERAKAATRLLERFSDPDLTFSERTEPLAETKVAYRDSARSYAYAIKILSGILDNIAPSKDLGKSLATKLRTTQFPKELGVSQDGPMLMASVADQLGNAKLGVLTRPRAFVENTVFPILESGISQARGAINAMSKDLEGREQRAQLIGSRDNLTQQAGESAVTSRELQQAAKLVREVWSSALESGAMISADTASTELRTEHPAMFENERQLDDYIEGIADVAKQSLDINLRKTTNRSAEGPGLA